MYFSTLKKKKKIDPWSHPRLIKSESPGLRLGISILIEKKKKDMQLNVNFNYGRLLCVCDFYN